VARIRTFKPEFLRHEELQELEGKHLGKYPMFVFMGLWSACDKQGVFPWKPKLLKLDIYPFLEYDMAETLCILLENGFVEKFETGDGREWGFVPNFEKHQRITGDEGKHPARYPSPDEAITQHSRHTEDTSATHPRHMNENGKRKGVKEREGNFVDPENPQDSADPKSFPAAVAVAFEERETDLFTLGEITEPQVVPETALIPSRSRSPPARSRKTDLSPEQLVLFHAGKAGFESDEKAKALIYQDPASTAREMKHLKTLAVRCVNIAPEMPAVFLENILEHFRIMCPKHGWVFTPHTLVTTWIWNKVIDSLPGSENERLRELVRGMFD